MKYDHTDIILLLLILISSAFRLAQSRPIAAFRHERAAGIGCAASAFSDPLPIEKADRLLGASSGDAGQQLVVEEDNAGKSRKRMVSMKKSWQPVALGLDPRHECR